MRAANILGGSRRRGGLVKGKKQETKKRGVKVKVKIAGSPKQVHRAMRQMVGQEQEQTEPNGY